MAHCSQRASRIGQLFILVAATAVSLASPSSSFAGGGPENVVVVVNGDSWASKKIANEFVKLRSIPPSNVIVLKNLPGFEVLPVELFRERILKPLLAMIEKRGLKSQIDYIVYSSDFPTAIDLRGDLKGKRIPRILTPVGSITGLTYLYEQVLAGDINYLQLNSNRYMRRPVGLRKVKPLAAADRRTYAESNTLIKQKKWAEAEKMLSGLAGNFPNQSPIQYNLACCLARLNKLDEAMKVLEKSVAAGWANSDHARKDDDLKPLREKKEFAALLKKMDQNQQKTFDTQPTLAFHSRDAWTPTAEKSKQGDRHYLLSTMLGVTSGRGNSASEAIAGLRRSAMADFTCPAGTIYYATNGDVRSRTREPGYRSAVAALKKLGVKAEIVKGVLPQNKQDVAGAMIGTATFRWPTSKSTILPGAICEHLTSFGGIMLERAGQTPLTEFLRHGAAGSSGTVAEPFAIQAKFPFAFLHVHYARGCSLAEAFYQSISGPYQLLIVGDPLCQPWAKRTAISVDGVKPGGTVSGKVTLTPKVTDLDSGRLELFIDGRRVKAGGLKQKFTLDTSKLADGYHEARVVVIRGDAIESQSRSVLSFVVNNRGQSVSLQSPVDGKVAWNKSLRLSAKAKGADSIVFIHNRQILGKVDGDSGQVDVAPLKIGTGHVRVFAVAIFGKQKVQSAPVGFTIVAPPAIAATTKKGSAAYSPGLLLTRANGKTEVIDSTGTRNWLSQLNLKANQRFTLEGEFQAEGDDIYQFQFISNCAVEIKIDGQSVAKSKLGKRGWRFVPVSLKKGRHQFELVATTVNNPLLFIRFGGRGARSLDAKQFRHRVLLTGAQSSDD